MEILKNDWAVLGLIISLYFLMHPAIAPAVCFAGLTYFIYRLFRKRAIEKEAESRNE